jgi:hypothetical protein
MGIQGSVGHDKVWPRVEQTVTQEHKCGILTWCIWHGAFGTIHFGTVHLACTHTWRPWVDPVTVQKFTICSDCGSTELLRVIDAR